MKSSFLNLFGHTPLARRRALWGILFILPNTLGLLFFFGIPMLSTFFTALQKWNGLQPAQFIGLDNFLQLVRDPAFWQAFGNTIKLAVLSIPLGIILALGVAILLNQRLPGRNVFRTIYFLPVVTSTVAASIVWTWIFQPRYGLIGNLLAPLGLRDTAWLTRPELILIPIAVVTIWQRLGFNMILFLSGLQGIPRILYEAAIIDGANRWQRFRNVTIPMLSPTLFLVFTLSVINAFQIFDQVYVMTARTTPGGVQGSGTTISYFLYQQGFTNGNFGYASAVAVALFAFVLIFTRVQLRAQRRWVYYEGEAE